MSGVQKLSTSRSAIGFRCSPSCAQASRQGDEGVGPVVHQLLPLVHRRHLVQLGQTGVSHLPAEQADRDHPDDPAAPRQGRVRQLAHQTDAPTAVHEVDAPGRDESPETPGRLPVALVGRCGGSAEHAHRSEVRHDRKLFDGPGTSGARRGGDGGPPGAVGAGDPPAGAHSVRCAFSAAGRAFGIAESGLATSPADGGRSRAWTPSAFPSPRSRTRPRPSSPSGWPATWRHWCRARWSATRPQRAGAQLRVPSSARWRRAAHIAERPAGQDPRSQPATYGSGRSPAGGTGVV
jgi:hypothetical protein